MYMAWLCYPHTYDDEYEKKAEIRFEEPEEWKYSKIIPI